MKIRVLHRLLKLFGLNGVIKLLFLRVYKGENQREYRISKRGWGKLHLRANTSDFSLLRDFYWLDVYGINNMYDFDINAYNIDDIKNVVDAGANIGLFSVKMSEKYPKANFYCIEPERSNFEILKKNVESLNAKCFNAGVWWKTGRLNVTQTELSSGTVGYVVREDDNGVIPGISISDLIEQEGIDGIDVLKMDIEGSEFSIFINENYKKWIHYVKIVIMEIHDIYYEGGTEMIRGIMKEEGFDEFKENEDWYFIRSELRR
ncbi:MAG: FkbM family methyltransferase [Lachnospiraceae bacterium]|nr:FkbM family methyltransferase [Lachnospiraceae bacterium]